MEAAMEEYLDEATLCRKWLLSHVLDSEARACDSDALLCDHYKEHGQPQLPGEAAGEEEEEEEEATTTAPTSYNQEGRGLEQDIESIADLQAGAELLHAQVQLHARGLADHMLSLQAWRGTCMICYHLPRTSSGQAGYSLHAFQACPNPARFRYMDAKRLAAKAARQQRGGWFPRFLACWMCYNPQAIYNQHCQSQCEFPNLVLPVCWSIFQKRAWVEQYLVALRGRHVADSKEQYMLWLGEEREVFRESAFNAMVVADLVLQQMALA
ncbi:hypothetical protein BJY00DRAFT_315861 [Aspergillus carlsbadensis]|nr:hypothetical protein BJY00DRAFT_315861 [Aspergillus carlsbadensis]